ncbi:MAG: BON domain-containing protein [Gammaproteobacteria bacterium]
MTMDAAERAWKQAAAVLERDPRVNLHSYPLQGRVDRGRLVLSGSVEDIAAKRIVEALVRRTGDGVDIVSRLRVTPSEHREDGALRDQVVRNLSDEPALRDTDLQVRRQDGLQTVRQTGSGASGLIEVQAEDGTVYLRGHVASLSHGRLAEVLAWWAGGCEAVVNTLQVEPPENDDDGELVDAVRLVLERDPLVHADHFTVRANGGVVRISGAVRSEEEKRLAVLDVWYVPGVRDVVDAVEVLGP